MSGQTPYPYLDRVSVPADMRTMSVQDLKGLANDVRQFLIEVVAQTGGHLGAGLGAVELAVALHYVFNTPEDKLVWDVGHQAYPHKILTGRKDRFHTIRQYHGLSGFLKRSESEYSVPATQAPRSLPHSAWWQHGILPARNTAWWQ
jgi:1-deoxy-D-xylulose-5-phosphate synthase